jgi:hypothetical protein
MLELHVTCDRHDITETMLIRHLTTITHSLTHNITPKDIYIICLSNLSIVSVPDEGYYSNVPDEG